MCIFFKGNRPIGDPVFYNLIVIFITIVFLYILSIVYEKKKKTYKIYTHDMYASTFYKYSILCFK